MHFDFTLPGETWKDVVGYESIYCISNLGRVVTLRSKIPRLMVPCPRKRHSDNRLFVGLWKNKEQKSWAVSVLVLTAFVGQRPPGMEACHFPDRDTTNNRVENLKWATHVENVGHRVVHDTVLYGTRLYISKLDDEKVREIRRQHATTNCSYGSLGRAFGVDAATIRDVVVRRTWKHVA